MANSVTRCPKCATAFRITEAILNSAKGAVRCGSCLHIFNAREYLLEEEEPAVAEQPSDDDDFLINDDEREDNGVYSSDSDSSVMLATTAGPSDRNLFERDAEDFEDDELFGPDESWTEGLLVEDDSPPQAIQPKASKQEPIDPTDDFIFEEDDNDSDPIQTSYEDMAFSKDAPEINVISEIDDIDDFPYRDQYKPTSNTRYLHSIEPEPVEFNVVTRYPIWYSKTLWTGLAACAGCILILQVGMYKFDDLSTVQPWRSYYAKACALLGCQLPQLRDRAKIKASNLVVRSHPTIDHALMVDAILRNTARFPQTFPPLDLVFTDIKNKPLAARRFEATEYLGGELAGKNNMPINQPVHIAIEISDPGPKAVSYSISIPE